MQEKILQLRLNYAQSEVHLCNGFCDWNNCTIPKWICLQCGNVECEHCSSDHDELVLTEEQQSWGMSICRICKSYDSTDEFPIEWRSKKELKLEIQDGEYRIAQSEWNEIYKLREVRINAF